MLKFVRFAVRPHTAWVLMAGACVFAVLTITEARAASAILRSSRSHVVSIQTTVTTPENEVHTAQTTSDDLPRQVVSRHAELLESLSKN